MSTKQTPASDDEVLVFLLRCVTIPAVMVGGLVVGGWVVSTLWYWYLVPLGVLSIGIVHAMGICCLLSGLSIVKPSPKSDELLEFRMITVTIGNLVLLGMGWVLTYFM